MTDTYTPPDREFAVATGSNVNSSPGRSDFDYPPTSTRDLIISANPGDTSPGTFSVGDVYDISYSGPSGAHTLNDATVIRSDPFGTNQGAIVFEGTNQDGELQHVVWAPNFDLEQWYFDNFVGGTPPQFYTTDQTAADYSFVCFTEGTLILTPRGHRPVEHLRAGDRVTTRDDGAVRIAWIGASTVRGLGAAAPVLFTTGSIGNDRPLWLSRQHRLLVDGPLVELCFGMAEMLAPAHALIDGDAIRTDPCGRVRYYHILLARHHILSANGAAAESLLLADISRALLPGLPRTLRAFSDVPARPILRPFEARLFAGGQNAFGATGVRGQHRLSEAG